MNDRMVKWLLGLCIALPLWCGASSVHEGTFMDGRARGFCCKREFEQPQAFEKIYVDGSSILSMPTGIFLKHDDGELELVRSLLADCQGMYVMRIYTQCPSCGKCYANKNSTDGYDCPLYEREVFPGMWKTP
jgi:hypothetical protein